MVNNKLYLNRDATHSENEKKKTTTKKKNLKSLKQTHKRTIW